MFICLEKGLFLTRNVFHSAEKCGTRSGETEACLSHPPSQDIVLRPRSEGAWLPRLPGGAGAFLDPPLVGWSNRTGTRVGRRIHSAPEKYYFEYY
jgi:hypothetical protein